jgi:hypothetical protein
VRVTQCQSRPIAPALVADTKTFQARGTRAYAKLQLHPKPDRSDRGQRHSHLRYLIPLAQSAHTSTARKLTLPAVSTKRARSTLVSTQTNTAIYGRATCELYISKGQCSQAHIGRGVGGRLSRNDGHTTRCCERPGQIGQVATTSREECPTFGFLPAAHTVQWRLERVDTARYCLAVSASGRRIDSGPIRENTRLRQCPDA